MNDLPTVAQIMHQSIVDELISKAPQSSSRDMLDGDFGACDGDFGAHDGDDSGLNSRGDSGCGAHCLAQCEGEGFIATKPKGPFGGLPCNLRADGIIIMGGGKFQLAGGYEPKDLTGGKSHTYAATGAGARVMKGLAKATMGGAKGPMRGGKGRMFGGVRKAGGCGGVWKSGVMRKTGGGRFVAVCG
jgi:hypothetical protein